MFPEKDDLSSIYNSIHLNGKKENHGCNGMKIPLSQRENK